MADAHKTILTLAELAEMIGAELVGDGSAKVSAVNAVADACETEIAFVAAAKFAKQCGESKAAGFIVPSKMDSIGKPQLIVSNVEAGLIAALNVFAPKLTVVKGVHPNAVVEESAELGADVSIGAGAYISHGATVGAGTIIGTGVSVGENSSVGSNCHIYANVAIYHECTIGNNCIIHANSTIGTTGFGYSFIDGQHRLIPHNGTVLIEDCVEIGANTCVDRAKFGKTLIGAGSKIDNLVQIAHNCVVGKLCIIAGQVAIAGSTKLGNGVVMGGRGGASDNLTIGDGAMIGGCAVAFSDVPAGAKYWGLPAEDAKENLRKVVYSKKLPSAIKQLKQLERRVKELEAAKDNN